MPPPALSLRQGLLIGLSAGLAACAAGANTMFASAPASPSPPPPPPAAVGMPSPMPMALPPPKAPLEVAEGDVKIVAAKDGGTGPGGWALVRQFPVPDYSQPYEGPRTDFRETIFWQPDLHTSAAGEAEVSFYLSDAVTSFRALAEGLTSGGQPGRGEQLITAKLPVSLAAKLPLEVSTGDLIELPVTITNSTSRSRLAEVTATFGAAFKPESHEADQKLTLAPNETRSIYYRLRVVGAGKSENEGEISLSAQAGAVHDGLKRVLKVVPRGYPRHVNRAGTIDGSTKLTVDLPETLPGSLQAKLAIYPSPAATLVAGAEAILREPTGCFEQASSSNYPNVMVLRYLAEHEGANSPVADRAQGMLDRGYRKLVGFEAKSHGFEWFGGDPGHEALTAYGLMQFADMTRVYRNLDKSLVKRTSEWLKSRRDGQGGYTRNARALDTFGRASAEVTNAYITYAMTEADEKDLDKEISQARTLAASTKDPYLLALAAGSLTNVKSIEAAGARQRLAALQAADGSFPGAKESITMSGGASLVIETTALATLALLDGGDQRGAATKALGWLPAQRSGGAFGSTQATVLALKALTRAAEGARTESSGAVEVLINGEKHAVAVDTKSEGEMLVKGIDQVFKRGQNTIAFVSPKGGGQAPWSLALDFRSNQPESSPKSPVTLALASPNNVRMGDALEVKVTLANKQDSELPMVIARIGIPGGLTYQTWQLDELREQKVIDFYETREREVIVYFRGLGAKQKREFGLKLLAQVPGQYTAPASQAYLYYTDEFRTVVKPLQVAVIR